MQVTIIPIVIGTFGTVTKGLLKGLKDMEVGGRVETISKRQHYWERPEILRKSPGDLWRLAVTQNASERPSAGADMKKL